MNFLRTHTCGDLRRQDVEKIVRLSGWVHRRRDHGGLIFIDLRDRYGLTQVVFNPTTYPEGHALAESLRSEWVISLEGTVSARGQESTNSNLPTGEIEILVSSLNILSKAKTPPFSISDEHIEMNEELCLRYRYLEMRRGEVTRRLQTRHKVNIAIRNCLDALGFIEVQTPILGKSTPEGARDYLVPSRIYPGQFYALPQSPQLFKQLLMVGGLDRYFQIAPCFRDEDLRADRQPEFTQIDIEMSFGTPEQLFPMIEQLVQAIFATGANVQVPTPFRRMAYAECMERFGCDKPDLRYGLELQRIDDIATESEFSVFRDQIGVGGTVKGLCVPSSAEISRKTIEDYTSFVGQFGIAGLAWMKMQDEGLTSNIVKFFSTDLQRRLIERFDAKPGDLLLFVADTPERANQALDHLRRRIARENGLADPHRYEFLWVTDFPLFAWDSELGGVVSEHHPFTSPHFDDLHLLETDPLKMRSQSYDLVLNGYEIASGSQRIHDQDLQQRMFELLRLSPEEIETKFGFFVRALSYGTPPHLGIALGLDRLLMILTQTDNIRDVIAFPKTQKASDLMMQAPSPVSDAQMHDLGLLKE